MSDLTARQSEVLAFIREHLNRTGYPPTRVDIAARLGFRSANAAEEHLRALARKGVIEMIPGRSRGLRLLEPSDVPTHAPGLPIIGRVAAGLPITAIENIEEEVAITPDFFRPSAQYLLRVRGDSMINAGIFEGDLVAVHQQSSASPGEIVVARVDDEVTVKRWQKHKQAHLIHLLAENPNYPPIEVDLRQQSLQIEGKVVGIIRRSV